MNNQLPATKSFEDKPAIRLPANKKLSQSRLHMAAIQTLPTLMQVELTPKEAASGATRTFRINDPVPCLECVHLRPIYRMQCGACKGLGYINTDREVIVNLPAGVTSGQELSFPELGRCDLRTGKKTELVVKAKIGNRPNLKITGNNITCILPVSLNEALLGAEIEVPTVDSKVMIKLNPLTQAGKVYLLRGKGINGGDLMVVIEVLMPGILTKEESRLLGRA